MQPYFFRLSRNEKKLTDKKNSDSFLNDALLALTLLESIESVNKDMVAAVGKEAPSEDIISGLSVLGLILVNSLAEAKNVSSEEVINQIRTTLIRNAQIK